MANNLTIGYWDIRGLAAPLRMMCEYAGTNYENKTYEVSGEPDQWDRSAWLDVKPALQVKNPMMNLPYILDGDNTIVQTNACFLYLGRKFHLNGKNENDLCKVEQILCQVMDLRNEAIKIFYGAKDDKTILKYLSDGMNVHFDKFENWLEHNSTLYTAGNKITTGDFHLWEMLDVHKYLAKSFKQTNPLAKYPRMTKLYDVMRNEPKLKAYFNSPMYKYPVNNKTAYWLGNG